MKITSESATQLVASDKAYGALLGGAIFLVIGLIMIIGGFSSHQLALSAVGLFVILLGVLALLLRKSRTLTIDKAAGTITLAVKKVKGGQNYAFKFADVTKLQLVSEFNTQFTNTGPSAAPGGINIGTGGVGIGNQRTSTTQTTQLKMVMRDGTTVDIADGSRSTNSTSIISHVPNQEVGQKIATFLGVPLEEVGPQAHTLGDVISGVQNMMHHNAEAPSAVPQAAPTQAPAPVSAPTPTAAPTPVQAPTQAQVPKPRVLGAPTPVPAAPDGPGFAMPHPVAIQSQEAAPAPAAPPVNPDNVMPAQPPASPNQ